MIIVRSLKGDGNGAFGVQGSIFPEGSFQQLCMDKDPPDSPVAIGYCLRSAVDARVHVTGVHAGAHDDACFFAFFLIKALLTIPVRIVEFLLTRNPTWAELSTSSRIKYRVVRDKFVWRWQWAPKGRETAACFGLYEI